MQSMPNPINVVSSNPALGELYSIQHYVIKFVCDLRQVNGFLRLLSPTNIIDRHTKILLTVAINTITLTPKVTLLIRPDFLEALRL